jgi:hypothetical protein
MVASATIREMRPIPRLFAGTSPFGRGRAAQRTDSVAQSMPIRAGASLRPGIESMLACVYQEHVKAISGAHQVALKRGGSMLQF